MVPMSAPVPPSDDTPVKPTEPPGREFARAPLVPVALAATCGLIADRYADLSFEASVLMAMIGLVVWLIAQARRAASAIVWLWVAAAGLAAAHHHSHRDPRGLWELNATSVERVNPMTLRGSLAEEPARFPTPKPDPLRTEPKLATTTTVLETTAFRGQNDWVPTTGRVRLVVEGHLDELHAGDVVEVTGRLSWPGAPANPGEWDYRSYLLDHRIVAEMRVKKSADAVTRLEEGWRTSLFGWLGVVRGWGARALQMSLPADESGLATALLLGDTTALGRDEWDMFVRTGVLHVLAISGQHLVILAAFVWVVLKALNVRRRHGAWIVVGVMIGYMLLTGARPSAVRATVMVCAVCLALVVRRPAIPANLFALAWLVVVIVNPTDPFALGCQLSFLSVFVLVWGAARWLAPPPLTPVEQLIAETRPLSETILRALLRMVWVAFTVSLILGVVNAPLILASQNIVAPIGILLTPPLVLLTSVALIAGFLLLLVSPLGLWAAWPLAKVTGWSLAGCELLVGAAERIPGAWVYAPAPSLVWLVGFYLAVIGLVLLPATWSRRILFLLLVWMLIGLLASDRVRTSDELRVTFLAVGHGGCVVIETPDGRVILYDAGTTTGPDAVRRVIAPFLWHRGITRIDELFVSHADLDHFNGLPELLKRFHVCQVTHTPSFPDKATPGVEAALAALDRHGVAQRVAVVGDRFEAGGVNFEVLHPPVEGPPGNENTRSMVLLMRHAGHTLLLTGDLEGEGQELVRSQPIAPVDVMLAPHHGGKSANFPMPGPAGTRLPGLMATWAKPKLVISSQRPGPTDHLAAAYGGVGATVWDTPTAGAVTVRCHGTGITAEAFRSGEVRVVARGR